MCNKLDGCGNANYHCVKASTIGVCNSIPGLSTACQERKPNDNNLSSLQSGDFKVIQYGNTSTASISTDDPVWSPGECLDINKYQGRFKKKQSIRNKKVIFISVIINFSFYFFRILKEQKNQRPESLLLGKRKRHSVEGD